MKKRKLWKRLGRAEQDMRAARSALGDIARSFGSNRYWMTDEIDVTDDARECAAKAVAALIRAERKLSAYVGVCKDDKELTDTVLPMVREALGPLGALRNPTQEIGARKARAQEKDWIQ